MREFNYINAYGYHKKLVVNMQANNEGKYTVTLWSNDTGDFCGSGTMTKEEINEYLCHYNINERI